MRVQLGTTLPSLDSAVQHRQCRAKSATEGEYLGKRPHMTGPKGRVDDAAMQNHSIDGG